MSGGAPKSQALLEAAHALAIDQWTAEVVEAFRVRGIDSILLKGPVVARWLYTDGEVRGYVDSDLLVHRADVEGAEGVLHELGFVHPPLDDTPGDKPWHGHAWVRSDGAVVDLHRTLLGVEKPQFLWEVLTSRTELWQVGGAEVAVLEEPARALHVALNAAQDGCRGQRSMEDLARALQRVPEPVWEQAAVLAEALGALAAMGIGLRLTRSGHELADRLGLPAHAPVDVVLRASVAPAQAEGFAWLASQSGLRSKAALVMRKAFPSRAFLRAWTPLARRGYIGLVAAYPYRLWWLGLHTPGAVFAWWRARRLATPRSGPSRPACGQRNSGSAKAVVNSP